MNEDLKKSKEYLKTIFNSVNDAIFIHDIHGNIIEVNDTATSIYGYSYEELIGMNIKNIISENSPYTVDKILKKISEEKNSGPWIIEAIAKNKNNIEFWVEGNTHIAMFEEEVTFIATVRNITKRKNAELASQKEAA